MGKSREKKKDKKGEQLLLLTTSVLNDSYADKPDFHFQTVLVIHGPYRH